MAYVKKETKAGERIRIEKFYTSRYGSKGKCTRAEFWQVAGGGNDTKQEVCENESG